MLLNRALSIKLVKTTAGDKHHDPISTPVDLADLTEAAVYCGERAAGVVAALYIGKKVLDTACTIAVIAAQKHI